MMLVGTNFKLSILYFNPNNSSYESQEAHEVGGTKKIFTYSGSTAEALLDSATTAYSDNDIVAYQEH